MASPGHGWKDFGTDLVVVRCAGGLVAVGYPVANLPPPPHNNIPQVQSSAIPVVVATTDGEAPATSRTGTDHESGSSTRRNIAVYLYCLTLAASIISVATVMIFYHRNNPPLKRPTFQVMDFMVSNFSISSHGPGLTVTATWEANLTVVNPNRKLALNLENIRSFVYYQNLSGQLSMTSAEPLHVGKNSTASIAVRTNMAGSDAEKAAPVEDIRQELRDTGSISFGLGIHFKEAFGNYRNTVEVATVYCKGLKVAVRFSGDVGFGTFSVPTSNRSSEVSCRIAYCSWWKVAIRKTLYC